MAPPSKLSITRRIRALGQVAERCECDAPTLVGTLLRLWCKDAFPALPKPALPYSKSLAAEPQIAAFVAVPNAGAVWPIPRSVEDVALLKTATLSRFRLSDYGYRVRIGAYVWNRDKRPKFDSLLDARRVKAHTAMPLMWSRDIVPGGIVRLEDTSAYNGEHRFVDLGDKEHTSVVTSPCVVMQRVTSNDQPRRLVAAAVSPGVFDTYGGFIGENHVVIIEAVSDKPALPPTKLAKLLSAHAVDRYFRCISGATNVSAFELNQLALPDPQALREALADGGAMEEAVRLAFGLVSEG